MALEFAHEPDAQRYTAREDGAIVSVLQYAEQGTMSSFHHTVTVPHRRGQGHAAQLVEFAVNDAERRGITKIVPSCWFVAEWFDLHPERRALIA